MSINQNENTRSRKKLIYKKCISNMNSVFAFLTDVDECAWGVRTCDHSHGICINTDGGFRCTCKAGYQGNGIKCQGTVKCRDVTREIHRFFL